MALAPDGMPRIDKTRWPAFEALANGHFRDGDQLLFTVGNDTAETFDWHAETHPSFELQATVRASDGQQLLFRTERLNAGSGAVMEIVHPAVGGPRHEPRIESFYGHPHMPPMFGLGIFWGRTWNSSDTLLAHYPGTIFAPTVPLTWGTIQIKRIVPAEAMPPDGCAAILQGHWQPPDSSQAHPIEVTIETGKPVPTKYVVGRANEPMMTLTLDTWNAGLGTSLPNFAPRAEKNLTLEGGLPTEAFVDGFAVGSWNLPTSHEEAMTAVRNHEQASRWLDDHRGAYTIYVDHLFGQPNTSVVDSWMIQWYDPTAKTGARAVATKAETLWPLTGFQEISVSFNEKATASPGQMTNGPSTESLDRLSQALHGGSLEAIQCFYATQQCDFGTHAKSGIPYAGSSDVYYGGIKVWMSRGLLLQNGYNG